MKKRQEFFTKRCIIVSLCVLLFYFASSSIVWKPILDLIAKGNSNGTKQRFNVYESKAEDRQNHEQLARTEQVLKEQNVHFDIKPQNREENEHKQQRQQQQTFPTRKNLIILSQGRGGSSFLGEIFNCNPQVMYWFEPLFNVGKLLNVNLFMDEEPVTYKDTCIRLIDSFFKCDFSSLTNTTLSELSTSGFRLHSKALNSGFLCPGKQKSKRCASFSKTLLRKACSSHQHTVTKILSSRLPNNSIQSFQEHFARQSSYDVKFINLVRDPRAVVYSWVKSNWIKNHSDQDFRVNVRKICDPMEKNVRYGLLSPPSWLRNRFKVIRYEDLVVNTTIVARELYRFAGFNWSIRVDKWVADHERSRSSAVDKNPYSLYRNASVVINKWKTEASKELIAVVEDVCGGLMNIMGYTKWNR
ncbi:carbohydrate sulfotransferase 3-like [Oculina patagonica]